MISGIIEILIENAGVQAMVGKTPDDAKYKVYPVIAETVDAQDNKITNCYSVVFQSSAEVEVGLAKDEPSTLDYPRVTIASYHKNFRHTELMGEAIRSALEVGQVITDNGYDIERVWLIDQRDTFDPGPGLFACIQTFGVEYKRSDGSAFAALSRNGYTHWGGMWNWAAHSNNLPGAGDNVIAGKTWLTEDDRGVPGDPNYYPAETLMVAKIDGASSFDEFSFNLA